MAQVGCYVPAKSARLTPIDRIMSRLGANDNIFAAQSTFFVELSETKKILSDATDRSLVILDELGRGTSSYDGVAVAQSVLHHVATHIGCVGYFATHYHSLADEFSTHPEIRPCRMQIDVDNDVRDITFLYKLEEGVAEGSFGMVRCSPYAVTDDYGMLECLTDSYYQNSTARLNAVSIRRLSTEQKWQQRPSSTPPSLRIVWRQLEWGLISPSDCRVMWRCCLVRRKQ